MTTEIEKRLAAALEARAAQVGPETLADRALPAPGPRRPRTTVLLAAAACLVAVAGGVTAGVLRDDAPEPEPAPQEPEVVVPPDVGRDWPRADLGGYRADLDGDGRDDVVRFRGEPDDDFAGRLRLEVRLSGGGAAYGVVDLGSTLVLDQWRVADLDGDGTEEVVIGQAGADGMTQVARVLALRDGVLVEAPEVTTDDAVLVEGALRVPGAGTEDWDADRAVLWEVREGELRSTTSARAFPAFGMSWYVPRTYVAESFRWRLGDDGRLRPEAADRVCVVAADSRVRACEDGEVDAVPSFGSVVTSTIGAGDGVTVGAAPSYEVRLEEDGTIVVDGLAGGPQTLRPDGATADSRIWPVALSATVPDTATVLYDVDDDGAPDGVWVLTPGRDGTEDRVLEAPDLPAGEAFTWVTEVGEVFSALGAGEARDVVQWAWDGDALFTVPLGGFCVDEDDPASAERC